MIIIIKSRIFSPLRKIFLTIVSSAQWICIAAYPYCQTLKSTRIASYWMMFYNGLHCFSGWHKMYLTTHWHVSDMYPNYFYPLSAVSVFLKLLGSIRIWWKLRTHSLEKCTYKHTMIFFIEYYGVHWRRQWHPTPVLLPGKSHGQRSLVGCSPWGR